MGTQATLRRVVPVAFIALLATVVLMVWVIPGSQAVDPDGDVPLGLRILKAAAGDTPRDGDCFGSGHITIAGPDPDRLSRMVRAKGRNAELEASTQAAPSASALADRTGGELVSVEGNEAHVLYVEKGSRRVLTYSRFQSSHGDSVWIVTGTEMKIPCDHRGD